jgi:hypothetical protein
MKELINKLNVLDNGTWQGVALIYTIKIITGDHNTDHWLLDHQQDNKNPQLFF